MEKSFYYSGKESGRINAPDLEGAYSILEKMGIDYEHVWEAGTPKPSWGRPPASRRSKNSVSPPLVPDFSESGYKQAYGFSSIGPPETVPTIQKYNTQSSHVNTKQPPNKREQTMIVGDYLTVKDKINDLLSKKSGSVIHAQLRMDMNGRNIVMVVIEHDKG